MDKSSKIFRVKLAILVDFHQNMAKLLGNCYKNVWDVLFLLCTCPFLQFGLSFRQNIWYIYSTGIF